MMHTGVVRSDGRVCGQCGFCTSGQLLGTRLTPVHVRHPPMLLACMCMDATHSSEGSSLKVGCRRCHATPSLACTCCNRTMRPICIRIASLCIQNDSSAASRSSRSSDAAAPRHTCVCWAPGHWVAGCTSASPMPHGPLLGAAPAHPAAPMPLCSLSLTPTARDAPVSASGRVRRCGLYGVRRGGALPGLWSVFSGCPPSAVRRTNQHRRCDGADGLAGVGEEQTLMESKRDDAVCIYNPSARSTTVSGTVQAVSL